MTGSPRRAVATCLDAAWASVLERPTTKDSNVNRGSSGEPPRESWMAGLDAEMDLISCRKWLISRFSRWATTVGGLTAQGGALRITADRTDTSIRVTAGRSDCHHVRSRSTYWHS